MTKSEQTAFNLKTILVNCMIAARHAEEIIREEKLQYTAKDFMNSIIRKLKSVEIDMCSMVSDDLATEIKKEVSENWELASFQNVNYLMQAMNDAQRQILESAAANIVAGTFRIEGEKTN